jgi:pre-mRNA-splicing factor SYF1
MSITLMMYGQLSILTNCQTLTPQARVHKSSKLWSFYVDLEESCDTLESTKKVYERIFDLRIVTPQIVVNYANFLEEHGYYEESFRVYERGLDHFSYPIAFELWNLYLTKFLARYGGTKLERARDLFEQALGGCPPKFAKPLYLLYSNLEEKHGLARHAMRIYERATRAVSDEDRFEMFEFYITKSAAGFGIMSTRPIYEKAIEVLPDKEAKEMCLKFANMERRVGEIDRARAIYAHGSQFADPRTSQEYWDVWHAFEVKHGNEDTFKVGSSLYPTNNRKCCVLRGVWKPSIIQMLDISLPRPRYEVQRRRTGQLMMAIQWLLWNAMHHWRDL